MLQYETFIIACFSFCIIYFQSADFFLHNWMALCTTKRMWKSREISRKCNRTAKDMCSQLRKPVGATSKIFYLAAELHSKMYITASQLVKGFKLHMPIDVKPLAIYIYFSNPLIEKINIIIIIDTCIFFPVFCHKVMSEDSSLNILLTTNHS